MAQFRPRSALRIGVILASIFVMRLPSRAAPSAAGSIAGCQFFPSDNAWNTDISNYPLDPNSTNYINSIGAAVHVHPDFGSDPTYGIPYVVVTNQAPVPVTFDGAPDESDPGPYPIPTNAPIEAGSDGHVLVVDATHCTLYELDEARPQANGSWLAYSGAKFDLNSNALRPDGWTSADAAGLPILAGLVRYDEVAAGAINHALRFTVSQTQKKYIHPATHYASSNTNTNLPPMGLRLRLKASFDISGFTGQSRIILTALKKFGMFVADNGSPWYISGVSSVPGAVWDDNDLDHLKTIPGSAFEVVWTQGTLPTNTPTRTATTTATLTKTAANTATFTATATRTATVTVFKTSTWTPSYTKTATSTATATKTWTPTTSLTASLTRVPSKTPTRTATATASKTATLTRTPTPTRTSTSTRTPTSTWTPTMPPSTCARVTEIPVAECTALYDLYKSTRGYGWKTATHWVITNNPCTSPWYGITCSLGHVTQINLPNNNLSGPLPASIRSLTALNQIDMHNNPVSGSIPVLPASLHYFDLNSAKLTGAIPTLPKSLGYLNLSGNQLTGPIPALPSTLVTLRLTRNLLRGQIPALPAALQYFYIDGNQINGSIPVLPGSLLELNLGTNELSGKIPALPAGLRVLNVTHNALTSSLPDFPAALSQLDVSFNRLTGVIPASLRGTSIPLPPPYQLKLCGGSNVLTPADSNVNSFIAARIAGWTGGCVVGSTLALPAAAATSVPASAPTETSAPSGPRAAPTFLPPG